MQAKWIDESISKHLFFRHEIEDYTAPGRLKAEIKAYTRFSK